MQQWYISGTVNLTMKLIILSPMILLLFSCEINAQAAATSLIDETLSGWTTANLDKELGSWKVKNGVIHFPGSGGGDIYTKFTYSDFILSVEWKVAPAANSGIKYRTAIFDGKILGLEYQVLDDAGKPKMTPLHQAGALYELKAANNKKTLMKTGEWNKTRIVAKGKKLEHWLNGKKVMSITIGDREWKKVFQKSKWKKTKGYGLNPSGRIMLQAHGGEVWYRKMNIAVLKKSEVFAFPPGVTLKKKGKKRKKK